MKTFLVLLLLCSVTGVQAQTDMEMPADSTAGRRMLEEVELPGWRLHLGVVSLPALNQAQKMKKRMLELDRLIEEQKDNVQTSQAELEQSRAELKRVLMGDFEESHSSKVLLGLFSHEKKSRGSQVVYNQKSLFWGAVKWGKRKTKQTTVLTNEVK